MAKWALQSFPLGDQHLAFAGIAVRRILSAELFREQVASSLGNQFPGIPQTCMSRWTDLAATLVSAGPLECYMVIGCAPRAEGYPFLVQQSFLAIGRGSSEKDAEAQARQEAETLIRLLGGTLDYLEVAPIEDSGELDHLLDHFKAPSIVELRRRQETIRLDQGTFGPAKPMGFNTAANAKASLPVGVDHIFPWVPSDDSWWRLAISFTQEESPAALLVHWSSLTEPSSTCRNQAGKALADTEMAFGTFLVEGDPRYILQEKAQALRTELMLRVSVADNPALCARVFLASREPASKALLSILQNSLDDASVSHEQTNANLHWKGGAKINESSASAMLAPIAPSLEVLYGPKEASAILRTLMPTDVEVAGVPMILRSRTAPMLGNSREGCLLGVNQFRGTQQEVRLDPSQRCRHTYIVGQTGTGKSTLMLHMVLDDIRRGQGVAVLDPHGTLIEDILLRYPKERRDDLVILDVTDVEHPVGFNILRIEESDHHRYIALRDLLIDELFTFMSDSFMRDSMGPFFEMHFRAMLGLLMGLEKPTPPLIPNLLVFRLLYTNRELLQNLVERIKGKDFMLEEFVQEALGVGGDWAIANVAPYITCKFSRFVSDHALRMITCQNQVLDLDAIVREGKVLLFYLGKGIIGDHAAGLLASQVVARIRRALMAKGGRTNGKQFSVYADEFQIFAGPRFAELLAEGRKFGLALTVAHQFARQIPEEILRAILGNVGTTVLFRIGPQDREFFDPVFSPEFTGRDLVSLPNYRAYVRSLGSLGQAPFNLDVPPPPAGGNPVLEQELRQFSRERYGRPREIVETEIATTYKAFLDFKKKET